MAGVDRVTGRPLAGFDHVVQSIDVIFTTRIGERVLRRWFGAIGPSLLGRLLNERLLIVYMTALAAAIDLWEPRFKVARVALPANPANSVRLGHLALTIEGEYRPRGHLGDPSSDGRLRRISVALNQSSLTVSES